MSTGDEIRPNQLPKMNVKDVLARAKAIYAVRGVPPYAPMGDMTGSQEELDKASQAEADIISEFVHHWLPYIQRGVDL